MALRMAPNDNLTRPPRPRPQTPNRPTASQMSSSTVENYLKQLYLQQQTAPAGRVPTGRLAAVMGVVPGTATVMMKALADSGLVHYAPRGGARLSPAGEKLALHVLRRHRIVELFLVKIVGLDWSDVHDEAERLEHAVSDKVLARLDAILDQPSVDPHCDPIPSSTGRIDRTPRRSLADCKPGQRVRVSRITDQDRAFLRFVEHTGLVPGKRVVIDQCLRGAGAISVRVEGGPPVSLGTDAAGKILVESSARPIARNSRHSRDAQDK
jgi:DtxR family transcriptional regulator, Mn-dependent transcriptional regulator